jgi:prevent-host-death family protein
MHERNCKIHFVGLKELRENMGKYIKEVQKGRTFIVLRRSKPVFKIVPVDNI